MLLSGVRRLRDRGWLGVVGPNTNVRRLLEIVGLLVDPNFRVFATSKRPRGAAVLAGQPPALPPLGRPLSRREHPHHDVLRPRTRPMAAAAGVPRASRSRRTASTLSAGTESTRPPEVCASAQSSLCQGSSDVSEDGPGFDELQVPLVPPGTTPCAASPTAPGSRGRRSNQRSTPTPARPAHLAQMSQQPEAGHVGQRPHAVRAGDFRPVAVERRPWRRWRPRSTSAGALPLLDGRGDDAGAQRLGEHQDVARTRRGVGDLLPGLDDAR